MSERAHVTDPRVRTLAEESIATRRRDIDKVMALIEDLKAP